MSKEPGRKEKKEFQPLTFNSVVTAICSQEGKKVEVSAGNVREVLRCLKDLCQHMAYVEWVKKYLRV